MTVFSYCNIFSEWYSKHSNLSIFLLLYGCEDSHSLSHVCQSLHLRATGSCILKNKVHLPLTELFD